MMLYYILFLTSLSINSFAAEEKDMSEFKEGLGPVQSLIGKKPMSRAQYLVNRSQKESPFGDTPASNIIADCGRDLGYLDMNLVLSNSHHTNYKAYFDAFETWLHKTQR